MSWSTQRADRMRASLKMPRVGSDGGATVRPGRTCFSKAPERPSFPLADEDVVAIRDPFGPRLTNIAPGIRKLVFNQGPYLSFLGCPTGPRRINFPHPYAEV